LQWETSPPDGPINKVWGFNIVGDSLEIVVLGENVDSYLHLNHSMFAVTRLALDHEQASGGKIENGNAVALEKSHESRRSSADEGFIEASEDVPIDVTETSSEIKRKRRKTMPTAGVILADEKKLRGVQTRSFLNRPCTQWKKKITRKKRRTTSCGLCSKCMGSVTRRSRCP
jgi:hypothetical protein